MKDSLLSLIIPGGQEIQAPEGIPSGVSLASLASLGISLAITFGVILSLFYLVYGGFRWIQSKGDKETLDKSRRIILYSILGLIVMSLSLVVVNLVATALGVETVFTPIPE